MEQCIFVGLGGFLGSVCRYLAGRIPVGGESAFPWKTLAINLLGAFVLGAISAAADRWTAVSPNVVLMLKVGVCGGFTTFSTFAFESSALLGSGKTGTAVLYMAASLVFGVIAVLAGQRLFS